MAFDDLTPSQDKLLTDILGFYQPSIHHPEFYGSYSDQLGWQIYFQELAGKRVELPLSNIPLSDLRVLAEEGYLTLNFVDEYNLELGFRSKAFRPAKEASQDHFMDRTTAESANNVSDQPISLEQWAGRHPTLAIVFTDVIDSTTIAYRMGDPAWIEVIQAHFIRGHGLIEKYEGREVKLIGDAFMAVFKNAVHAFDFVLDLYQDPGHPAIKIRAGIHVGAVRVFENEIFGIEVNFAKRIESSARNVMALSDPAHTAIGNEKAERHKNLAWGDVLLVLRGFPGKHRVWRAVPSIRGRATRPVQQPTSTSDLKRSPTLNKEAPPTILPQVTGRVLRPRIPPVDPNKDKK